MAQRRDSLAKRTGPNAPKRSHSERLLATMARSGRFEALHGRRAAAIEATRAQRRWLLAEKQRRERPAVRRQRVATRRLPPLYAPLPRQVAKADDVCYQSFKGSSRKATNVARRAFNDGRPFAEAAAPQP